MMIRTTSSSISVKPLSSLLSRCLRECMQFSFVGRGTQTRPLSAAAKAAPPPERGIRLPGTSPATSEKKEGAVSRALSGGCRVKRGLAVRSRVDGNRSAGAVHVAVVRAHLVLQAVRRRGARHLRELEALVDGLQTGDRHAGIRLRVAIGVERLGRRKGRADVGLGRGLLSAVLEAKVRRDGDREQHADDDQNDEQLDQREAALILVKPLSEGMHAVLLCRTGYPDPPSIGSGEGRSSPRARGSTPWDLTRDERKERGRGFPRPLRGLPCEARLSSEKPCRRKSFRRGRSR